MELTKVILKHDNTYLLLRKPNIIEAPEYSGVWETVGGKFKEDESSEVATKRELIEEIGVDIPNLTLLHEFSNSLFSRIFVFFKDLDVKPEITLSKEHVEYGWFTLEEIQQLDGVIYKEFFLELVEKSRSLQ